MLNHGSWSDPSCMGGELLNEKINKLIEKGHFEKEGSPFAYEEAAKVDDVGEDFCDLSSLSLVAQTCNLSKFLEEISSHERWFRGIASLKKPGESIDDRYLINDDKDCVYSLETIIKNGVDGSVKSISMQLSVFKGADEYKFKREEMDKLLKRVQDQIDLKE